jgi:hypothetical protein
MTDCAINATILRDWARGVGPDSLDHHLEGCRACQDRIAGGVADRRIGSGGESMALDDVWHRVRDAVEVPRPSRLERSLGAIGLPATDARIVAEGRALRHAWLGGLLLVLGFVARAASLQGTPAHWVLLVLAPLVPSVAVALAHDPAIEPALDQELATPYPAVRLVLLRTVTVLAVALPLVGAAGWLVPGRPPYLWLLPAVGFAATGLALSTWTSPVRAVGTVAAAWAVVVGLTALGAPPDRLLSGPAQPVYAGLAGLSVTVLIGRLRHRSGVAMGRG